MDRLRADLRLAFRRFARSPGFTLLAVLALALGVGASTAVFSVVSGVLLRPLPVEEPERLSFLTREGDVSIPDGVDWRAEARKFETIALVLRTWAFDLTGAGEPERIRGMVAEPEYFDVFRMRPLRGRTYTHEENRLGSPHVAVVSEGFWKRRLGSDPAVLGRVITLSDHATTIVGVMPARFDLLGDGIELWVPPATETPWAMAERGTNNFDAVGRLAPGATIEEARAEMVALTRRLEREYPKTNRGKIVEPLLLLDFMVGRVRPALLVLLGAVVLVVLITSVNLSGLLLARAFSRRQEFSVRLAVGAGRARLLRQMVTEGLVLSGMGGVLGVLLAYGGVDALLALAPESLPRTEGIGLDVRVLAFALLLTAVTGLATSLVPALSVLRADPGAFLAGAEKGSTGAPRHRVLGAIVAAEAALAFLLLVGSGLLVRSFFNLSGVALGFDPGHVLLGELGLPESRYSGRERQTQAFRQIVERVAELPGVSAAATVIGAPLEPRGGIGGRLLLESHTYERGREPGARHRPVTGDYFATLRVPIVEGRAFTPFDDENAPPVAIVNRRFAREFWPGRSALGQRLAWRDFGSGKVPRWMSVVGVAEDVKGTTLEEPDVRAVYTPYPQRQVDWQSFGTLLVRVAGDPRAMLPAVRQALWSVDPSLPLADPETLEERCAGAIAQRRFNALALGVFAAAGLLIALQGLYAVLAYSVEARRREMGVRLALGAEPRDLMRLVIGRGLLLATLGLAAGFVGALALVRLLHGLVFGVAPIDSVTFALAGLGLAASALLASAIPACRAARLDPAAVLHSE